jgi:hypothetical protein
MPERNLASIGDNIVPAAETFDKQADDQTILPIRRAEQVDTKDSVIEGWLAFSDLK